MEIKRGALIGLGLGVALGVVLAAAIVWIGLAFDDSSDGVAPLVAFGVFSAVMMAGFLTAVGAVIGLVVRAVRS